MKFDLKSKTFWALMGSTACGILGVLGVHLDPGQLSTLSTSFTAIWNALTVIFQAGTIVLPILAAIWHQLFKDRMHTSLVNAGVSHQDAAAATKS